MPIRHKNLHLHEVFLLIGSLTLRVFGLEPSLCWLCDQVTYKRQAFGPSLSSTENRKGNTFLEVAQFLPCVPRGTQGKANASGPRKR